MFWNRPAVWLLILALAGVGHVHPRQASGAAADRPNILFLIADDWGWNHSGVAGCKWVQTPTFDRIAREGVFFKNAFTSNPKCSPSRASILTGRNTWQLGEACCHYGRFSAQYAVYPDLLEKAGYCVGCTGKGWAPGDWKSGGFAHNPAGWEYNRFKLKPPRQHLGTNDEASNFEDFLKQRKPGQPFCFWVGSNEPHRPYDRDAGIRAGKKPSDVTVPAYLPDSDVVRRDLLDYATEVEWGDQQFGRVLDVLKAAGELDRTLIVMTSDHGMPFPRVKGQIYEDAFRVPLAMRWPSRVFPGRAIEDFVTFRDLAPTFLELAGVKPPTQMSGHSLVGVLESKKSGWIDPGRKMVLMGKERHDVGRPHDEGYPVRAIQTPDFLLVHNYTPDRWPAGNPETLFPNCDDGPSKSLLVATGGAFFERSFGKRPEFELYQVSADPQCLTNLSTEARYAPTLHELRTKMEATLREEGDPRVLGDPSIFERAPFVGPRRHAYDEWLAARPATGPPTPSRLYNVLFVMADDLNCDLGAYGHPLVKSPNIDRLAKQGLKFDRAYCQFPLCGPSRAALMCGLYPDQTLVHRNGVRIREHLPNVQTLAQTFREGGYVVVRVGKIFHYGVPGAIGTEGHDDPDSWDYTINPRGRDKDDEAKIFSWQNGRLGSTLSWLAADGTDEEQTDGIGATEAIKLLESYASRKTQFFLAVGFYRPHTPYVAPKKYFDQYSLSDMRVPQVPAGYLDSLPAPARFTLTEHKEQQHLPDEIARQSIRAYCAAISFMDSQVGRLLDALRRLNLADETIVVFTSDHGYHMGEHGHYQKMTLFENSARVPLIISIPGMKTAGQSTKSLAQLIDLYPTLAELCGLQPPKYVQGVSLVPALNDSTQQPRTEALTQLSNGYSLRTDRYRYTEWGPEGRDGAEFYDHQSDPRELTNLVDRPELAEVKSKLAAALHDRIEAGRRLPQGLRRVDKAPETKGAQ